MKLNTMAIKNNSYIYKLFNCVIVISVLHLEYLNLR